MTYEEMIKQCGAYLASGQGVTQGGTKALASPLVSVFLGNAARENGDAVRAVFRNTWPGEGAAAIQYCDAEYSADREEDLCLQAMQTGYHYPDRTASFVFYYWDVMDGGFEENLREVTAALERTGDFFRPTRYFFIFFSQAKREERETAKERIGKIFDLVYETEAGEPEEKIRKVKRKDVHLVLLGDMSGGIFVGNGGAENYRLAADISVILGSRKRNGQLLENDLAFRLRNVPVMSAGYHSEGKPVREIVCASLEYLLNKWKSLQENAPDISLAEAVEDRYGGYAGLFGLAYDKFIRPLLPEDGTFWRYVPYTKEAEALSRRCAGEAAPETVQPAAPSGRGHGLLRGIFGAKSQAPAPAHPERDSARAERLAAETVQSLGTFWDAVMEVYYFGPVRRWLSDENGENALRDFLEGQVSSVLTSRQMRNPAVRREAEALTRRTEAEVRQELRSKMRTEGLSFAQVLKNEAELALKSRLFTELYHLLGRFVLEYAENAGSFANVLQSAANRLGEDAGDAGIREAYGALLENDLTGREREIRASIRPCGSGEELYFQLEKLFASVAAKEEVFRKTYPEELSWRLGKVNPEKIADILSGCFRYDVRGSLRVRLVLGLSGQGIAYTILSTPESVKNEIEAQNVDTGEIFEVPRSDYIERIYIQEVDPDDIAW